MKLFFCYEKSFCGSWSPVVYYGDVPRKTSKDSEPVRTTPVAVTEPFIDGDTPNFGRLRKAYPAPGESV